MWRDHCFVSFKTSGSADQSQKLMIAVMHLMVVQANGIIPRRTCTQGQQLIEGRLQALSSPDMTVGVLGDCLQAYLQSHAFVFSRQRDWRVFNGDPMHSSKSGCRALEKCSTTSSIPNASRERLEDKGESGSPNLPPRSLVPLGE